MTFTEAAVEVLRREGKPLQFRKITEIAVRENLLDHVGKIPEEVMADQLAAHCRLPRTDRLVMPVLPGTFALVEWQLDEDPTGLDNLVEPPPAEELPYRGRERHPIPARELARASGRGADKGRRREEGEPKHGRRFPPPAEVAYEILASGGQPISLAELAAQGAERQLMPDAFVRDPGALGSALGEDNRRRESSGRRALFQVEGETVTLVAQPEPGEQRIAASAAVRPSSPAELRRAGLAALRRKLRECEPATFEHLVLKLLEKLGYREIKVARRGREHVLVTARKRMGLADVRHGFRVLRTGADAMRRDVIETRRDLGHHGAQIGAVVTPGEAQRDARAEGTASGQLPVLLFCGEALAEACADVAFGCVPVVIPEVDHEFFAAAAEVAGREEQARRARRDERGERGDREERGERKDRGERREGRREEHEPRTEAPGVSAAGTAPSLEAVPSAEAEEATRGPLDAEAELDDDRDDDEEEEEEGGEGEGLLPADASDRAGGTAAPGEGGGEGRPGAEGRRKRRRRRRRGGRGRGERREGGPVGEPGGTSAPAGGGEGTAAPAGGGDGAPSVQASSPGPAVGPDPGASGA